MEANKEGTVFCDDDWECLSPSRRVFYNLEEESRKRLSDAGHCETLKKGTVIFREQDMIDHIMIVKSGYVSIYCNSGPEEIRVIYICASGDIMNETVAENERSPFGARALSDVTLLVIKKSDFDDVLKSDVRIVKELFRSLSGKTRSLYQQLGNIKGNCPIEKRLSNKIWKLASYFGKDTKEGCEIEFEVTVTFLGNMIGAKRETVSRAVSILKKEGYIIHEKGIMTVPDMERLKALA